VRGRCKPMMTVVGITYSAVLITKDRPDRALGAIAAILEQRRLPARVVVVDASELTLEIPESLSERASALGVELRLVAAAPNTGAQRNIGVEQVETEITLYIDDDVSLPDDYVDVLLRRWEARGLDTLGGAIGGRDMYIDPIGRIVRLVLGFAIDNATGAPRLRRSGKMIHVNDPEDEVFAEAVCVGATLYRTDLLRRFPFEERFAGYVLGEDIDVSYRIGRASPILVSPLVRWDHPQAEGGRDPVRLWYCKSRHEAFFRWRRIDRSPVTLAAYGWSVATETLVAATESVRARNRGPITAYLSGFRDWFADLRSGVSNDPPAARPRRTADRAPIDSAGEPARP
jgi:GT2 family glycosyltransferase